eukprot:SAG31_NODE_127_length_23612_cov_39.709863_4_plen_133_part_00
MSALPYIVQIAKTQTVGAIVEDSVFEDSSAFYGRWKSSHSVLRNCTFRGNGICVLVALTHAAGLCCCLLFAAGWLCNVKIQTIHLMLAGNPELEMQLLPSFYEGPVHIENITSKFARHSATAFALCVSALMP